jgi:hypothetical protein
LWLLLASGEQTTSWTTGDPRQSAAKENYAALFVVGAWRVKIDWASPRSRGGRAKSYLTRSVPSNNDSDDNDIVGDHARLSNKQFFQQQRPAQSAAVRRLLAALWTALTFARRQLHARRPPPFGAPQQQSWPRFVGRHAQLEGALSTCMIDDGHSFVVRVADKCSKHRIRDQHRREAARNPDVCVRAQRRR